MLLSRGCGDSTATCDRTHVLHYLLVHSYIYPVINPANHLVLLYNLCW